MKTKKILSFLVVAFTILIIQTNSAVAADQLEPQKFDNRTMWTHGINLVKALTKFDGESAGQVQMKFVTGAVDNALGLIAPETLVAYDDIKDDPDIPESMKTGLVGVVDDGVVAMFNNQPNVNVIAHLSNEWIPGYRESSSAYAAGYDDLQDSKVDVIWSMTRNIAYLGFVLVMIVIGFMIMFRNKIGGQALVTIGNTLPRVVISLILVTFSFAIIGLVLDFSGVLMRIIDSLLGLKDGGIPVHNIYKLVEGTLGIRTGVEGAFLGLDISKTTVIISTALGLTGPFGGLVALVIVGVFLTGAIKLWFALLKSYLGILLNVITAPLVIMFGALPGNDASTMNLFKSVLRNALVFPVAYAIVNIPYFLADQNDVILTFPETITGSDPSLDLIKIGALMTGFAKIIAIFVAAQTPVFMKTIIPGTASKSGADIGAAMKEGFGKVPFIGGMFK